MHLKAVARRNLATRLTRVALQAKRRFTEPGTHVFITCPPKTGSTFLEQVLIAATGFEEARWFYGIRDNEEDLYRPFVIDSIGRNTVAKQHTRATEGNLRVIKEFGLRPVILVRDLYDSLVSLRDHMLSTNVKVPPLIAGPEFRDWQSAQQLDFVTTLATPWYLGFYKSWVEAVEFADLEVLWLNYETMTEDPLATMQQVATFAGFHLDAARASAALAGVDGAATRFNQGVTGRGRSELSAAQRAQVAVVAALYAGVDFSPIGIGS